MGRKRKATPVRSPVVAQPWTPPVVDPDDELPDPEEDPEECEDCGEQFTHMSGCTRMYCDPCLKARLRAEKIAALGWGAKMYGPPLAGLAMVLLTLGPSAPTWLFAAAWVVAVLAWYGAVVSGELGSSLAKAAAACKTRGFWTYRRFWVRLGWVVAVQSVTLGLWWAFWWVVVC